MNEEVLHEVIESIEEVFKSRAEIENVDIYDMGALEEALDVTEGVASDINFNLSLLVKENVSAYLDGTITKEYKKKLNEKIEELETILHDVECDVEFFKDQIDYIANEDISVLYSAHSEWL